MKGLIIKEFLLSIKFRIIVFSIYALLLILCILVKLSALYGNIADMKGRDMLTNNIFMVMALGFPAVIYCASFTYQVHNDEKCRFRQFSLTMPLSSKEIVGAEFVTYIISFCAATVISFLNYFLACAVYGRDIDLKYLLYIFIMGLVIFIVACLNLTLAYRFRNPKIVAAIQVTIGVILYFGVSLGMVELMNNYFKKRGYDMFSDDKDNSPPDELMTEFTQHLADNVKWASETFWWLFIAVGLLLVLFSYHRSVRAFERRES